jgi:hypothetical protein
MERTRPPVLAQDRDTIRILDASVSGARSEFFLHPLREAPPADRYRLAPLFLPLKTAACQARIDPLVLHRRQGSLGDAQQLQSAG